MRATRFWLFFVLATVVARPMLARPPGDGNDLIADVPIGTISVTLELLVDLGPDIVADITNAGDGSGRLFLVSPDGVIRIHDGVGVLPTPFLNAPASPPDRAMSGVAFHPDFANNGKLYVITGEAVPNDSTPHYSPPQVDAVSAFDNVLVEYCVDSFDPNLAATATRRELLRVHQAQRLHNMNDITFGGDGYLYVAMGDGGDTRTGSPTDYNTTGQQTTNPYGSILRIDVDALGTNGRYGIPVDNPFASGAGGNVPEIFAWGVRNPWRISTDRLTGDVYTGVNGDITIEQVYRVVLGKNYGWDTKEGSYLWNSSTGEATVDSNPSAAYTAPLGEYDHNNTLQAFGSVIGGFVYRGSNVPGLFGKFVFLDYVAGELIAMDVTNGAFEIVTVDAGGEQLAPYTDITWGEGEDGELYIGRADGKVYRFAQTVTAVPQLPPSDRLALYQNVPNPFSPSTLIAYDLFEDGGHITLTVFDVTGRRVRTLVNARQRAGRKSVRWDSRDDSGDPVAAGVYFYRLESVDVSMTLKMVLLR